MANTVIRAVVDFGLVRWVCSPLVLVLQESYIEVAMVNRLDQTQPPPGIRLC